jgi:hypothetical protein
MNFKTTGILALVLLLGISAVLFLNKKDAKKETTKKTDEQLLQIKIDQVTDLFFKPSGVHCKKDSSEWKIVEPVQADGDKSTISAVLNMFNNAKKDRIISSDPAEYSTFGLEPAVGTLVLVHNGASDTLWVGDETPTGSNVFARKSGSPDVFITATTLKTNVNKSLFDLRDKSVLSFETSQVRSLQLDDKNGQFKLAKSGGEWSLTAPKNYPADKSEVDKLLNRLNSEKIREFRDENPQDLRPYGLDAPVVRVDLSLGENLARKTLFIGKPVNDKFYARDEARPPVFLVDSAFVSVLSPKLFDLRNKKLNKFTALDVSRFELEFSGQTIVCTKDSAGTWTMTQPPSRKPKSWKMSSIIREATELQVAKFIDAIPKSLGAYGLASPQARARFYDKQGLLVEVLLGKVDGENVYAKIADQAPIYLVGKTVLETWTPKLDDISDAVETTAAVGDSIQ